MTTVNVDQMKSKLLTIEQVHNRLSVTEPLHTDIISSDTKVLFKLEPGWETTLDALDGDAVVDAVMRVNGRDHSMTKDAALQAASNFGIPAAYVKKVPGNLIEKLLNYHYSGGMGDSEFKVLSVGNNIAAFTRPTVMPFSNLQLLESAVEGIHQKYGSGAEILADYKMMNSLQQTDVRLIVPEHSRTIRESGMGDIPQGGSDIWSAGLHLTNSLIGKKQTSLEAYMFRWWCTNGATTTLDEVGTWSRRTDGQDESVYEWARKAVDAVLGGMEDRFDQVQALTQLNVGGNTGDILRDIFTQYSVPVSQREAIAMQMQDSNVLTMYTIMQAITQTANTPELDPRRADKLMRIGGAIPTVIFDTVKAKVWREGHIAQPTENNPYEITSVAV